MNEKFNIKSKKEEPLSIEETQDMANKVRVIADVYPSFTGKVRKKEIEKDKKLKDVYTHKGLEEWNNIDTSVTKEDYEEALNKVEEIERLANEETNEEVLKFKIKKILQLSGQALALSVLVPFGFFSSKGKVAYKWLNKFKENREKLADAKTTLKKLIKEGDEFGETETRLKDEKKMRKISF